MVDLRAEREHQSPAGVQRQVYRRPEPSCWPIPILTTDTPSKMASQGRREAEVPGQRSSDVSRAISRELGPPLVYVNLQLRRDSDPLGPVRADPPASKGRRACPRAPAARVSAPRPPPERRAPERGAACSRARILLRRQHRHPPPLRDGPSLSRTSVPPDRRLGTGAACGLRADHHRTVPPAEDASVPDRTRPDVRPEDGRPAVEAARQRLLERRLDPVGPGRTALWKRKPRHPPTPPPPPPPLDAPRPCCGRSGPGVPGQASEMNPVNATSLYVSASRSVLQCDPGDPRALAELCRLLPFFRQSVSCLVCGNLLRDPIAPVDSACQHYVCRGCKGQRMQLKPSCSWCKDYSRFQENRQLSLLVRCYRKLCRYITQSPLAPLIASAAGSSPDLQAVLNEGLGDAAEDPPDASLALAASEEEPPAPSAVNGLHGCNGLAGPDPVGRPVKEEGFTEEVPVCVRVAGEPGLCDDLKHGSGPLLLSVEEVLRTLDADPDPGPDSAPPSAFRGPRCLQVAPEHGHRPLQPSLQPPPQPARTPPRCRRKRSRSESDSEKVQPLPISSLLLGSPFGADSSPVRPHLGNTDPQDPKFPAPSQRPHLAPVPNGGCPKVGKTVLISSKNLKKTVDHHGGAKKVCAKARQGASKPRPQSHDRVLPHALTHPPSPSKPQYKKPVEKKGCKCGRATQNPSVLTCRGQRCPCYSNRKACLDCICRGCQNSYMANGEKKLEAFAVPEKALEQTRLTLGINLTSIAAAALRGPSAASPGALLNVAAAGGPPVAPSFLSGAGHDGFEDSLEMRFDC
ncbi:LOW QUALITY PROTEIN: E3 ubiquitin-protein ligase MSL2-like [Neosynchiropus ocellatus]